MNQEFISLTRQWMGEHQTVWQLELVFEQYRMMFKELRGRKIASITLFL
jgi:hypothetical protein